MFALVRFLNEFDEKLYVVAASCIVDFHPTNETDYDKKAIYTTYWEDEENPDNTDTYSSQILLLANTKEALENKRATKRPRKAVVHPSDLEVENDTGLLPDKVAAKQGKKREKLLQEASKASAYESILQEQLANAQKKNTKAASAIRGPPKRRRHATSDSEDDTDKCVVSSTELRNAKKDAAYWRHRYNEVSKEKTKLISVIESMQKTIDSKLSTIHQLLESQLPRARTLPDHHHDEDHSIHSENMVGRAATVERRCAPELEVQGDLVCIPRTTTGSGQAASPGEVLASISICGHAVGAANKDLAVIPPSPPTHSLQRTAPRPPTRNLLGALQGEVPPAQESDPQAMGRPKFSDFGGGRYHVNRGTTIGSFQAEKIMGHVKPSMVAKDMAVALWGRIGLAQRTYGGKVAPKDYKNPDCVARKELSPAKVGLVLETVQHWGQQNKVPVNNVVSNISNVLAQKIQDTRKALRRQGIEF
uniref:BEN domain-containing protein n=1 Tax=Ixodes ricinus TaxID=34613 RepID=A0A6B0VDF2_IXORI